jgi:hypothetical protein
MQIFIRNWDTTFKVDIDFADTIWDLKLKILYTLMTGEKWCLENDYSLSMAIQNKK